ncbi:MAG TPA: nuclease-related domain-containing protein [Chloroflexota bacterium]|nr:nuclease-related domain-containing protein [Chloroflexota bacterium]
MRLITMPDTPRPWAPGEADTIGAAGERAVIAVLQAALDDRYAAISRLRLPGTEADLDLVVLAERVVVLEVKAYRAPRRYRCERSTWSYADGAGEWWPLDAAPGTQATFGALRVRRRLATAGLATAVEGAVVWAGDAPLALDSPRPPVLRLSALAGWLLADPPASPPRTERMLRALLAGAPCTR